MRDKFKIISLIVWMASMFLSYIMAYATGISGTKHDLTTPTTTDPCIFCHTWRNPAPGISPLWNRNISNAGAFVMYTSPTMKTTPSMQPGPYSLACLTCHDDAGASSAVNYKDTHTLRSDVNSSSPSVSNCSKCHAGGSGTSGLNPHFTIGHDLRDDHPVSMPYPTNLSEFFNLPPDFMNGWTDVKLYSGKVECGSCHDPHDTTRGMFLRKSNRGSALCTTCHKK